MALAETRIADIAGYPIHSTAAQTNQLDGVENASAVSWAAIIAGATIAAAASLVLLALGTGLGLSAISPWAQRGVTASTFGVSSIVWVIVTQLCASALGGYLAGRLRTRWTAVHTDEVYFRDTVHGLLSWALASLVTACILLTVAASAVGAAAQTSARLASGAAMGSAVTTGHATHNEGGTDGAGPMGYLVDSLFRKGTTASATAPVNAMEAGGTDASRLPLAEVTRIFVNASGADAAALPPSDVSYLGQVVSQRTGLQQTEAERRVTDTYRALQANVSNTKTIAAEAADKARKAGIQASLWLFIAMLSGAFIASYTAMLGGRERDL